MDHVLAIEKGGAPLAEGNLRLLCKLHHSQKTRNEDAGKQSTNKALVTYGLDGWPIAIEGDRHGNFKDYWGKGSREDSPSRRKAASFGTASSTKEALEKLGAED